MASLFDDEPLPSSKKKGVATVDKITINKSFAEKYAKKKEREDLSKLKAQEMEESDDSDLSDEDEVTNYDHEHVCFLLEVHDNDRWEGIRMRAI